MCLFPTRSPTGTPADVKRCKYSDYFFYFQKMAGRKKAAHLFGDAPPLPSFSGRLAAEVVEAYHVVLHAQRVEQV